MHRSGLAAGARRTLECKIMNIPIPDKTWRVRHLTRILENASPAFGEFIRVIRGQVPRPARGFLYTKPNPYRRFHPPTAVKFSMIALRTQSRTTRAHGVRPRPQTCRERCRGPRGRLRKLTVGYGSIIPQRMRSMRFSSFPLPISCLFRISSAGALCCLRCLLFKSVFLCDLCALCGFPCTDARLCAIYARLMRANARYELFRVSVRICTKLHQIAVFLKGPTWS